MIAILAHDLMSSHRRPEGLAPERFECEGAPVSSTVCVDHLVVAADSLAQGAAWCEATFGVQPAPGGRHASMGTHNRLLKVAAPAYPDAYLEIIAVDPEPPAPGRPRWFGLDDPALRARLKAGPRLIHVVARCEGLETHRLGLVQLGLQPGEPLAAGRDTPHGRLTWTILVRPDGTLPCRGALPTLIQWDGRHPAAGLPDSGVALRSLALHGVPEAARDLLGLRGVAVDARAGAALRAVVDTPRGQVVLESD